MFVEAKITLDLLLFSLNASNILKDPKIFESKSNLGLINDVVTATCPASIKIFLNEYFLKKLLTWLKFFISILKNLYFFSKPICFFNSFVPFLERL